MFKLYYRLKIWKLKRDLVYYEKITGEFNIHKQKELNYYVEKLDKCNQQTFCYCPLCWNELISSDSFVSDEDMVTYKCSKCGIVSIWDFNAPVPILIKESKISPFSEGIQWNYCPVCGEQISKTIQEWDKYYDHQITIDDKK